MANQICTFKGAEDVSLMINKLYPLRMYLETVENPTIIVFFSFSLTNRDLSQASSLEVGI